MGKKTQLDKAIEALEADRKILDLAIEKLKTQASAKKQTPKRPKIAAVPNAS